ncbi:MAG: DUF4010 domain-containing protein [Burkholderiaceae bacterium]|nr:DUF4010 domain-containing protein [Burkholderiaceae bacterium]
MPPSDALLAVFFNLSVALGIGLLVGAERERRKGDGPARDAAGIRTFAVAALLGAVAQILDQPYLLTVAMLIVGALAVLSHARSQRQDPGMTTEVALVLTSLLGALAMRDPGLAAGIGAGLTALLAARDRLHRFVRQVLSERELHDVILFAAAALIILPLAPDRYVGPFHAVNLHELAGFVVLVMSVSAAGYIAKRTFGHRGGLALTGFAGGFVSSTATILAMGKVAKEEPQHTRAAVSGAVLSTVSTMVQLGLLVWLIVPSLLPAMVRPLAYGGAVAVSYAIGILIRSARAAETKDQPLTGHAFDIRATLVLTVAVSAMTLLSAALNVWLGAHGVLAGAAITGFVDAHSIVASLGALVNQNSLTLADAKLGILFAFSTNAVSKALVAAASGNRSYTQQVLPGLAAVVIAVWIAAMF